MGRVSAETIKKLNDFICSLPEKAKGKCALCNQTLVHIVKQAEVQTGAGTATVTKALAENINETAEPHDKVTPGGLRYKVINMERERKSISANGTDSGEDELGNLEKENEKEIIKAAKKLNAEKALKKREANLKECEKKFRKVETCAVEDLENLIKKNKKYSTIYADPPWQYSNQATRASTDNHYNTMSIEQISKLPIPSLTEDNAHLHLWTTNAFLFDAKEIIESWGFEYKSCFIWVKPQMGIGNYWRVSHEFMLFGIKGKQPFLNRSQKSWESINRTKHSKKPEEIAQKIELVSPGPYLELFGRNTRKNWTVWGNEIERHMFNGEAFKDNEDRL